jgi:phosphinothricin acetyltransferase
MTEGAATLRAATAADAAAIAAIYRPAVLHGTASFEVEPPDEAEMLRRFQAIRGAGYPYFVAELGGRIAGYAYASAYRTRPAYCFTVEDSSTSPLRRRAKASAACCWRR